MVEDMQTTATQSKPRKPSKRKKAKRKPWGGSREGAGRKREVEDGYRRTVLFAVEHGPVLDRLAEQWGLESQAAAVRYILDNFDF